MMTEDIKKKYVELSGKHMLPKWEYLNNEFEVYTIENTDFLLRDIRRKMTERIEFYSKILEEFLQPEPTFNSIYESKNLNEEKKRKLFETHRKIMIILRHSLLLGIENTVKGNTEFITKTLEKWLKLKEELKEVACLLKDSWNEELSPNEKLEYFG